MGLSPNPGPAWRFEQFDRNADYKRLGEIQGLMDATNPDFSRFKRAGGKLIFYHGWSDSGLSANASIELYETIERTMGGRAATQEFMRLFMVPDMDHCGGGAGPNGIDYLEYLDKWVDRGEAPDLMIGAHYSEGRNLPAPSRDTRPKFTRPIYPYPLYAKYKGSGDPNDASSFRPASLPK
jgi:feruloyl esterase